MMIRHTGTQWAQAHLQSVATWPWMRSAPSDLPLERQTTYVTKTVICSHMPHEEPVCENSAVNAGLLCTTSSLVVTCLFQVVHF